MNTLPEGWTETTLGQLGRYHNGRGFRKSEWRDSGRPIIRIQNLTGTGNAFNYFGGEAEEHYIARPGDLLVSWAATLGAYIWHGPEAVVNQHIFKVESKVDRKFHKYLLDFKLAELMGNTHGSGMVHITRSRFDAVPVVVPPLDEQRRIVEILEDHLSRLDAAEAAFALAQRRLRTWQRSMIQQLTWGAATDTTRVQDLVGRVEAGRSFGGPAPPARDNEWGIIKVSAMTWGEFRPNENKAVRGGAVDPRYEIRSGDLLVSRANTTDYVGAPVYVESTRPRLLLSDKSLRLVPRTDVSAQWLALALSSPAARAQVSAKATGTKDSMRNISQASLLSVRLPAMDLADQETAVSRADALRRAQTTLERDLHLAASRSQVLRRALLEAAFSGRLTGRLSEASLAEEIASV